MRTATRNTQLNLDIGISSKIQFDVKRKTIKQNVTKKKKNAVQCETAKHVSAHIQNAHT